MAICPRRGLAAGATNRRNHAETGPPRRGDSPIWPRIRAVRSPVLHRWLHAWACLAMLLVVLAPLVSRALTHPPVAVVQPAHAHVAHSQPVEIAAAHAHPMHHDSGHGMDHAMTHPPGHAESAPAAAPTPADPHAQHDMGVDCDYCLIAARMISLLVALLLLMTVGPVHFRALAGLVATRQSPSPGTLGARGPPHALAC